MTKSSTGRILKQASKPIPKESMDLIADEMKDIMRHQSGIYALYNNNKLFYVGRTQNLRARIKHHMRGKFATKWNKFRIFLIDNKHLPDVETIVITIAEPEGNKKIGLSHKRGQLDRIIRKAVRRRTRELHQLKRAML